MADEGYFLSEKSKFVHTLDSYVYSYISSSGGRDVLKIEINYSDRVHILAPVSSSSTKKLNETVVVKRLADEELIGTKLNALLVRTTPRDIYDVYTLFKGGYVKNEELIRKIAIFYICLGSNIPVDFQYLKDTALLKIKEMTYKKIRETLIPVLHKGIIFDVTKMAEFLTVKLSDFFILDKNDEKFIQEYNNKHFLPSILFDGYQVEDVSKHPMGIWKTK